MKLGIRELAESEFKFGPRTSFLALAAILFEPASAKLRTSPPSLAEENAGAIGGLMIRAAPGVSHSG